MKLSGNGLLNHGYQEFFSIEPIKTCLKHKWQQASHWAKNIENVVGKTMIQLRTQMEATFTYGHTRLKAWKPLFHNNSFWSSITGIALGSYLYYTSLNLSQRVGGIVAILIPLTINSIFFEISRKKLFQNVDKKEDWDFSSLKTSTFPSDRYLLAQKRAAFDTEGFCQHVQDFYLSPEETIDMAKRVAKKDGYSITKYVKNFGIEDEKVRLAIALLACENAPDVVYEEKRNYALGTLLPELQKNKNLQLLDQLNGDLLKIQNKSIKDVSIQELEEVLKQCHTINRDFPLPVSLYHQIAISARDKHCNPIFNQVVQHWIDSDQMNKVLELMQLAKKYPSQSAHELMQVCHDYLSKKYPNLEEDVAQTNDDLFFTGRFIERRIGENQLVFPAGVQVFPPFDFEELEKKISEFIHASSLKAVFFINFKGHFSPLYLEKKDHVIKAFNSDSVGRNFVTFFQFEILNVLTKFPQIEPYFFTTPRQADHTGCSLFTLHDLKWICRQRDFFSEIAPYTSKAIMEDSIQERKLPFNAVQLLPPKMLKLTQSISLLKSFSQGYKDQFQEEQLINQMKKYSYWELAFDGSHRMKGRKLRNVALDHKKVSYYKTILQRMFGEKEVISQNA